MAGKIGQLPALDFTLFAICQSFFGRIFCAGKAGQEKPDFGQFMWRDSSQLAVTFHRRYFMANR
jgi:hypothetical protein